MAFKPSYLSLFEKGELRQRAQVLQEFLKECRLCPRKCRVNRLDGEIGICQAGSDLMISSAFPHFGEEPPWSDIMVQGPSSSPTAISGAFSAKIMTSAILARVNG